MGTVATAETRPARQELLGLTAWRGIAAVLVVLFHLDEIFSTRLAAHFALGPFTRLVERGYAFVDLFFILSGFVIAHVYGQRVLLEARALGRFLALRLGRIYPMHLVVVFILALDPLSRLLSGDASAFTGNRSGWSLVTELLLLDSIGLHDGLTWNEVSWSVSAEWLSYLLAPVLLLLIRHVRLGVLASAAAMLVGWLGVWAIANDDGGLGDVTFGLGGVRGILGFTIGIAAYRVHTSGVLARVQAQQGAVLLSALAVGLVATFAPHDAWFTPTFVALILTSVAASGAEARLLENRALRWLGDISYSTYLLQQIFLAVALSAFANAINWSAIEVLGASALWLLSLLAVSTLTYRRIEVPARDAVRSRVKKREADPKTPQPVTSGVRPQK